MPPAIPGTLIEDGWGLYEKCGDIFGFVRAFTVAFDIAHRVRELVMGCRGDPAPVVVGETNAAALDFVTENCVGGFNKAVAQYEEIEVGNKS